MFRPSSNSLLNDTDYAIDLKKNQSQRNWKMINNSTHQAKQIVYTSSVRMECKIKTLLVVTQVPFQGALIIHPATNM